MTWRGREALFARFEALAIPVAVAMHGTVLGGGDIVIHSSNQLFDGGEEHRTAQGNTAQG